MYIFAVEKYRVGEGQFPPCLVAVRPAPPYIGWRGGGKSTTVIHNLWKTTVEKLHTRRFRVYFRGNIGFSTAVFNRLWITHVENTPFSHRKTQTAGEWGRQQHLPFGETDLGKLFEKSFPGPLQKLSIWDTMDIVCAIPVRQMQFVKLQVLQTIRKPFATSLPRHSGMSVLIFYVKK